MSKTALVVSAHPGDFVWWAGGAIALHAKKGYRVKIVCLAFGERGESQFAWKQPGMTLDKVKVGRRDEAERAAAALGAEIEFFDAGDYPLCLADAKGEKRAADEDGKRKQLASGALGLDMYNMREPLAKAGLVYIDEPESD
jgi:4-oxalomesaconate hydratase